MVNSKQQQGSRGQGAGEGISKLKARHKQASVGKAKYKKANWYRPTKANQPKGRQEPKALLLWRWQ